MFTAPLIVVTTVVSLLLSVFFFTYSVECLFNKRFGAYANIIGGVVFAPFIAFVAAGCLVLDLIGTERPFIK